MKILIVDKAGELVGGSRQSLEELGHALMEVATAAEALELLSDEPFHLLFARIEDINRESTRVIEQLDAVSPHLEVIVFSPSPSVGEAVEAMQSGAADFVPLPCTPRRIERIVKRAEDSRRAANRIAELQECLQADAPPVRFDSEDDCMRQVFELASTVAATPTTVLLLGESGTGKSLLARAIHDSSGRAGQPFVTISCPSLSQELLESELFGHVRGAFTGAIRDRFGKVAAADGGTLFLDEIGDLPTALQPKLLRLLQEREYERLGETKTRKADVRIVAATNVDLLEAVESGAFREDLYYRLNVVSISAPPLRERPRDLERVSMECLEFYAERFQRKLRGFHPRALHAMKMYEWPGNLRELDNAVERAVILAKGEFIDLADLPSELRAEDISERVPVDRLISLEELERAHLQFVTERTETMEEAAQVLGIDKSTLFRKRKRYGLA